MKAIIRYMPCSTILAVLLTGCSLTREPVRHRTEFFQPVTTIPQRGSAMPSLKDIEQLGIKLQSANQTVITLLDSLNSMQRYTGSLLESSRALVDKVSELESKEFIAVSKQKELEQNVAALQTENKDISKQLMEIRKKLFAAQVSPEPQAISPASLTSSLQDEYSEGIALFRQRKYDDALAMFDGLLEKGIERNFADHCEYWKGECHFAIHDYSLAISNFQKVLTMDSSNKKSDAYFMLGRSYEQIGDGAKARWAYEELSFLYPNYEHIKLVKSKLFTLEREFPSANKSKRKKASI